MSSTWKRAVKGKNILLKAREISRGIGDTATQGVLGTVKGSEVQQTKLGNKRSYYDNSHGSRGRGCPSETGAACIAGRSSPWP